MIENIILPVRGDPLQSKGYVGATGLLLTGILFLVMGKRSFVLHVDSLQVLDDMPDDFAGKLFKAIKHYQTTGEVIDMEFALKMAAMPFIRQFERDSFKYQSTVETNRINGSKGGRPTKSETNQNNPFAFSESESNQPKAKKGDSDSDSGNDSKSVSKKQSATLFDDAFDLFWNAYGNKKDKPAALKAWKKVDPSLHPKIMQAIPAYLADCAKTARQIRNPATWLNGECWNDEYTVPVKLKMPYL